MRLPITLAMLASCNRLEATPASADQQAVTATVKLYFQGHATGDGEYFRRAFHTDAKLFWIKDGKLAQKTSAEFAAGAGGKPEADEAKRVRKIALVDIADDVAVVKVELDYPSAYIVDYLSLVKIDGTWMVINKIFHRGAPKPAVPSVR